MPISNDPKAPRARRLSNVAGALRRQQAAGAVGKLERLDPAQQAELRARAEKLLGLVSPRALADLDQLWSLAQYRNVLEALDERTRPLIGAEPSALFRGLDAKTLVELACQLYILEGRVSALVGKLAGLPPGERAQKALALQQRIADAQTELWHRAVELANAGAASAAGQWMLFRESRHATGAMAPQAHETRYLEKMRAFFAAGGDPAAIRIVDASFVRALEDNAVVDIAVDGADVARAIVVDENGPGADATLLAHGGDVVAFARVFVNRDTKGGLAEVRVSASDALAVQHTMRHLVAAGVPVAKIVAKEGELGTARALTLLADALAGAEAQRKAHESVALAVAWDPASAASLANSTGRAGFSRLAMTQAQTELRLAVSAALLDGAVLSTQRTGGGMTEVEAIAQRVDEVMRLAESGGNALVYRQTLALVDHLVKLPAPNLDEAGREQLSVVAERWRAHTMGHGAFDPADVFSPQPLGKRRTRIVATINPKATDAQLVDMVKSGMDVARFNTAHGDNASTIALMKRVRAAAGSVGRSVTIQVDLEGPKIRLGLFANPQKLEFNDIILDAGKTVTLTTRAVLGDATTLAVDFPSFCDDVKAGDPVFMNDGNVELRVVSVDKVKGDVTAEVIKGGKVWDKKGINLPGSALSVETITAEDLANLTDLLPHVDLVAPSFVRSSADVRLLRAEMEKRGRVVPIIAKIERPEGVDDVDAIAREAEALMVARGDLGVEIGWENVPAAERRVTSAAKLYGKPVMVATEVFMSMVKDPSRPSRGDVEALFAAVSDRGADAVMLAKETSFPAHPAEVIRAVNRVIESAEEA